MKNFSIGFLLLTLLCGCYSGTFKYVPSNSNLPITKSIEVEKSKDSTWNQLVAGLSSNFFAINTMDNKSGFINLSYAVDPEQYVEGGELHYTVRDHSNEYLQTYNFPATRANVAYQALIDGSPHQLNRQVDLRGKMNIVVSEISPSRSRVTVNINYVLNVNVSGYADYHETLSLISGEFAKSSVDSVEYCSNGKLEEAVLALVR